MRIKLILSSLIISISLILFSCGETDTSNIDTTETPDTETPDTGTPDTGTPNSGTPDSGDIKPFITRWNCTNNQKVVIYKGSEDWNATIDWGDNQVQENVNSAEIIHTYASPGIYEIKITGLFPSLTFFKPPSGPSSGLNKNEQLITVVAWGDNSWESMVKMFKNCAFLEKFDATDKPDLSKVKKMYSMFERCEKFNQNINNWDVSNVTNMSNMFAGCKLFNQPLNGWNVSNVTSMAMMFQFCTKFNQPLNGWNVSKVTNMTFMFNLCRNFNQNINNWTVTQIDTYDFFARGSNLDCINTPNFPNKNLTECN